MTKKLKLSSGIETYEIDNGAENGAILRVNMADPNLYIRFLEMQTSLEELEKEFEKKMQSGTQEIDETGFAMNSDLQMMKDIDGRVKEKLAYVFELDNDFDKIFAGVNVMAVDSKGNRIVANFLEMLTPVITQALQATKQSDDTEIKKLVGNRVQRRAVK